MSFAIKYAGYGIITSHLALVQARDCPTFLNFLHVYILAMFKYADDTYIVIPARNTQSRGNELDNVSKWALANNLRLNKAKCVEIVSLIAIANFRFVNPPQCQTFNVLRQSVYWASLSLTACPSVNTSRASLASAPSLCTRLKILRSHGMSSDALKVIYKSVVL